MFANNYVNHEKDRSLEVPDLRHPLKMTYGQRCQLYHNFRTDTNSDNFLFP